MSELISGSQAIAMERARRKQAQARKIQARQDRRLGLAPFPDYLQLVWSNPMSIPDQQSENPESVKNDEKA